MIFSFIKSNHVVNCNQVSEMIESEDKKQTELVSEIKEDLNLKENKPQIPDSMDIKIMFIDQLQDKLASIKNNNSSGVKKWSKTNSGNLPSTVSTPVAVNLNDNEVLNEIDNGFDSNKKNIDANNTEKVESETMLFFNANGEDSGLLEKQALNEMNKIRSKWGSNCGENDNMDKRKMTKRGEYEEGDDEVGDDSESENIDINSKELDDKKKSTNLKRKVDSKKDLEKDKSTYDSKSLRSNNKTNKLNDKNSNDFDNKSKKFAYNLSSTIAASSQIQVTIWKDDNATSSTNGSSNVSQSSVNSHSNVSSRRTASHRNNNEATGRKDAIADRIIHASRAVKK